MLQSLRLKLQQLRFLRSLIDDDSQPSVVSAVEGCFAFPPCCPSLSSDESGSDLLTGTTIQIEFFDIRRNNPRQKQAHHCIRRLVTLWPVAVFYLLFTAYCFTVASQQVAPKIEMLNTPSSALEVSLGFVSSTAC